jgi:hypothetical protein
MHPFHLVTSISSFFSTPGFAIFRNREIATGSGAIREQLADLDLRIIIENSLVEWKELEDEGYSGDEWAFLALICAAVCQYTSRFSKKKCTSCSNKKEKARDEAVFKCSFQRPFRIFFLIYNQ